MRIRLPKPMHGWRAFSGEVGVIVLGVLIALGASQLVEDWQWRVQMKREKNVFQNELVNTFGNAYLRLAARPCLDNRLQEITERLNQPGTRWRAMPDKLDFGEGQKDSPKPYNPPFVGSTILSEGWSNALANGAVNHLPIETALHLARVYAGGNRLQDEEQHEEQAAARLAPLALDRELSADSRIRMLQDVAELQRINNRIAVVSGQIFINFFGAGLGYTWQDMRDIWKIGVDSERSIRGSCVTEPEAPTIDGRPVGQ